MGARLISISRLRVSEQRAVKLLRDAAPHSTPATAVFADLRRYARRNGLTLLAIEAPFLGVDEAGLLGLLAQFQRKRPPDCDGVSPDLSSLLLLCARALTSEGIALEYRNIARDRSRGQPLAHPERADRVSTGEMISVPREDSLQGRVLKHMAHCGAISHRELRQMGLSRHMVSLMNRRGLLRRVRFGMYVAARETCEAVGTRPQ